MVNPIEIRTLSGVRLDVYPSATIEVNMGGISLLNLQDRTATYTNSFKLPRTPTNENVFAFASQPTRNNRPVVDVIVTKGVFQKQAVLKVIDFGTDYSCSLSYDIEGVIDMFNNNSRDIFPQDDTGTVYALGGGTSNADSAKKLFEWQTNPDISRPYMFASFSNTTIAATSTNRSGNASTLLRDWITQLEYAYSITASGSLLSDSDFLLSFMTMPNYAFYLNTGTFDIYSVYLPLNPDKITISSVLKAISHIFLTDIKVTGKNIQLELVSDIIQNAGINIEGFSDVEKKIYSGYLLENNVKYTTDDATKKELGKDTFTGDGVGVKDALIINSFIPKTDSNGYITNDGSTDSKICIFHRGTGTVTANVSLQGVTATNVATWYCNILSMSGFYSNILNPIFSNPIILEASKYLDPLTSDTIMTNRVINSVQLGGRYWVDTMAYNLTTGQSKLTLIKLP